MHYYITTSGMFTKQTLTEVDINKITIPHYKLHFCACIMDNTMTINWKFIDYIFWRNGSDTTMLPD